MVKKKSKHKKHRPENKRAGKMKRGLTKEILRVFDRNSQQLLNYKQVSSAIDVHDVSTRSLVHTILEELVASERLVAESRGKYKLNKVWSHVTGTVSMTASGAAFIVTDDIKEDVYISPKNQRTALHGDTVEVHLLAKRRRRNPEGEVLRVVKRARSQFVGKIQVRKDFAFLVPDSIQMHVDLYIPLSELKGAKDGQKAIAKITDWPDRARNPFGEIVEVLGDAGDHTTEMQAILAENGFPLRFPDGVEAAAEAIDTTITAEEVAKRRDFRKELTFTIDPEDAKDFDDALSFKKLRNGNFEVGIHIADVTHYVKPGDAIDKEAIERATSVYLVDRVIPMLPEVLSNVVCSLRANEDKLVFTALFEMTPEGNVLKQWFGRGVIHSDRRFTYEEVQEILEAGKGELFDELKTMDTIAKTLRAERMAQGSIAFEKSEVRFKLDDEGNPETLLVKESKDAHKLIEEYMLLANRKVAEWVGKKRGNQPVKSFVYRIHDAPDNLKIKEFDRFIRTFGYRLQLDNPRVLAKSFNELLRNIKGKPEQSMIELLAIRTMQKAIYGTDNMVGHYGLGFTYYTHFTSPIRRYPDVMVHRLLQSYLDKEASADLAKLDDQCQHCSLQERKATEAERDSTKYFQVRYMEDRVGEVFEGVVSGVSEWGIYVQIAENKCEGMVPLKSISDDYYHFDEEHYRIVGSNTGNVVQLGQEVHIRVRNADLTARRLEFELADGWEKGI